MANPERLMLVSSDCHAGAPWSIYRDYLDPHYRNAYERWVEEHSATHRTPTVAELERERPNSLDSMSPTRLKEYEAAMQAHGHLGNWDPAVRARELDREGIAGEVIFPDGSVKNPPPFGVGFILPKDRASYELRRAGCHAHNRWLADFCLNNPGRHAGVALVALDEPADAVAEITWAKQHGLHGGIMLPPLQFFTNGPESFWHHPRYEPVWAACEELAMPVNAHVAGHGVDMGGILLARMAELMFNTYRPFWLFLYGGILERHPRLKLAFAEAGGMQALWFNPYLDWLTAERPTPELKAVGLSMKPSDYWRRQCYVGASAQSSRAEIDHRDQIGVENIMWGSDYPHPEGTWPASLARTRQLFAGVPDQEVRLMLGVNAAHVYGFDLAKLRTIADRIGPALHDINAPADHS